VVALIATGLFLAKLFGHGHADYEVLYHWQLHTGVLRLVRQPVRSRLVTAALEWYLGPLYGYVPRIYKAEHLLVHHPESSGPTDITSPLRYHRTSLLEFTVFAMRMCGILLLGAHLVNHRRCRGATRRWLVGTLVGYWICVGLLLATGRALGVWLAAVAVHRAVSATCSQYEWHGLIRPTQVRDPMTSTLLWLPSREYWSELVARAGGPPLAGSRPGRRPPPTLEETEVTPEPGTDWAFFDNNHLVHHLYPKAHFRQYPQLLAHRLADIRASDAAVLDLAYIDRFAFFCWAGDYENLAQALIHPEPADPRHWLHERLTPVAAIRSPYGQVCDTPIGRRIDRLLLATLKPFYR
jgi:hypothetical protein